MLKHFVMSSTQFVILSLFAVAVPSSLRAEVISLAPGSPIQPALDAASPGDIVQLGAGTWSETVRLAPGVTLKGAGVGMTVLTGAVTVPASASSASLEDLTLGNLTATASDFLLRRTAVTGAAYFDGSGNSLVEDAAFQWYLVTRASATTTFRRISTSTVAYTWEMGRSSYEDSVFGNYLELKDDSNTSILRSSMKGAYPAGRATLSLVGVSSTGAIALKEDSSATIEDSTLDTVSWQNHAFISLDNVTASLAKFVVSPDVDATLTGIGPAFMSVATGSSASTLFGADIIASSFASVALEVYGDLTMVGGGYNRYSYVLSGGYAALTGTTSSEILVVESGGGADFYDATLAADFWVRGALGLHHTTATRGSIEVQNAGQVVADEGAEVNQLRLMALGSVELTDATVKKAIVMVENGRSAVVDGLVQTETTGQIVTPGAVAGPSLLMDQSSLKSIQLWVQGEADIFRSVVDDYVVVEQSGIARMEDTRFLSFALFRGDSTVSCLNCRSDAFLYAESTAHVSLTQGQLLNYAEFRGSASSELEGVLLNAQVYATATSETAFTGCTSTSGRLMVGGSSKVTLQDIDLSQVQVLELGRASLFGGRTGILTLEVSAGTDFVLEGFRPGVITASGFPQTAGMSVSLAGHEVGTTSLLVRGHAVVGHSELTGYAYTYSGATSSFNETLFRDVTYFQADTLNTVVGGRIERLFNAQGSVNFFDGTVFAAGASIYFGGTSSNTFTRCTFEQGVTLSDQSVNDFGQVGGANPGLNDFGPAQGWFKLANRTGRPVNAQNCFWGSEDPDMVAGLIIDVDDDATLGRVNFLPLGVRNRIPLIDAGPDQTTLSFEQDSVVLEATAMDPDGDALTYRWLEGDDVLWDSTPVDPLTGDVSLALSLLPTLEDGEHTFTLEVTEEGGEVVLDDVLLTIGNSAPSVTASGAGTYGYGEPVFVGGEAGDYDGDLLTCAWRIDGTLYFTDSIETPAEGATVLLPELPLPVLTLGVHTLILSVDDGINAPALSVIQVHIVDWTPPVLAPVATPSILWPPDGKMHKVIVDTFAMDAAGGAVTLTAAVTSNQPSTGRQREADWTTPVIDQGTGIITVSLRAERTDLGLSRIFPRHFCKEPPWNGAERVYTIWMTARDASGNVSESRVQVVVPRWGYGFGR